MAAPPPPPSRVETTLAALRDRAQQVAPRSYAPFSGQAVGAALLLSDGCWVPGVRVESGSFPLTIPALQGAWVTAVGAARHDILAVALSRPLLSTEGAWLVDAIGVEPVFATPYTLAFAAELPALGEALATRWNAPPPTSPMEGVGRAREIAAGAHAPFSDFPVGCLLEAEGADGETFWVSGVNVEHPDWTRGLCAERSALAAAFALGARTIRQAFLSCPRAPDGTPCGGCRQLLAERLPDAPLTIDRGAAPPEITTPRALLPDNFTGDPLQR